MKWIEARVEESFTPYSYAFVVIGTFMLWISWIFFNGGSALSMFVPRNVGVPKIMMNTLMAGAAGGIVSSTIRPHVMKTYSANSRYDVGALCNGILGGCVAVTASSNNIQPWAAFVIGICGGVVYVYACKFLVKAGIDDPLEASAVHGFCGGFGIIATGIFDNSKGLFSGNKKEMGKFFGWQICGMLVIVLWTGVISALYFIILNKFGLLRVKLMEEIIGLDISEMGVDEPKEFKNMDADLQNALNEKKVSMQNLPVPRTRASAM